jgi:hypothetical protein
MVIVNHYLEKRPNGVSCKIRSLNKNLNFLKISVFESTHFRSKIISNNLLIIIVYLYNLGTW